MAVVAVVMISVMVVVVVVMVAIVVAVAVAVGGPDRARAHEAAANHTYERRDDEELDDLHGDTGPDFNYRAARHQGRWARMNAVGSR